LAGPALAGARTPHPAPQPAERRASFDNAAIFSKQEKDKRGLDLRKYGRMLIGPTEPAMPTESGKPLIVISYAHADEPEKPAEGEVKWLSFVTGYLRPATKQGAVELWLDQLMPGGADWEREIESKLRACDIYILLVSANSMASSWITREVEIIRRRQATGEEVPYTRCF
jgi:hypothetical protein